MKTNTNFKDKLHKQTANTLWNLTNIQNGDFKLTIIIKSRSYWGQKIECAHFNKYRDKLSVRADDTTYKGKKQ